jgi:peroxiredoxin
MILIVFLGSLAMAAAVPQERDEPKDDSDKQPRLATISGSLEIGSATPSKFQLSEFEVTLNQFVHYEPMPLPADWGAKTPEERQAWMQAFPESDEGKAYLARREAQESKRKQFTVELEPDGSFIVYDVPVGTYNLFGRQDVEQEGRLFAVEVYGQIEVGAVDEVKLPPLPLEITRILRVGEVAPEISLKAIDGSGDVRLSESRGKPVLVYFWTAQSPTAESDLKVLRPTYDALHGELGLEILAICADEDLELARQFIREKSPPGMQGASGGWSHAAFRDYGVRSIPQYFLVGPDGTIRFTNQDFYRAFEQPQFEMIPTIRDTLASIE